MKKKQIVTLNENDIRRIVTRTIKRILNEDDSNDTFKNYTTYEWDVVNKMIEVVEDDLSLNKKNLSLQITRNLNTNNLAVIMDNTVLCPDYDDDNITYKEFVEKFKKVVSELKKRGFNPITKPKSYKKGDKFFGEQFYAFVEVDVDFRHPFFHECENRIRADEEERRLESEKYRKEDEARRKVKREKQLAAEKEREKIMANVDKWKGYSPEVQKQMDTMWKKRNIDYHRPKFDSKRSNMRWYRDGYEGYVDDYDRYYDNITKEFVNSPNAIDKFKKKYDQANKNYRKK